jgi:translocator protein
MPTKESSTATNQSIGRSDVDCHDQSISLGVLPWINLAAFVVHVGSDAIVHLLGLASEPEIAVKYQSLVTPVGWAFTIVLLIFVVQGLWVGLQLAAAMSILRLSKPTMESIFTVRYKYAWTIAAQLGWSLLFTSENITLSPIMMFTTLWFIGSIVKEQSQLYLDPGVGLVHYILLDFPMALHCGWIVVGMAVNPNIALVAQGFGPNVTYTGSVIGVSILTVVALALNGRYGLVTIPLVVSWGFLGMYAELSAPQESIQTAFSTAQLDAFRTGTLAAAIGIVVLVMHDSFRRTSTTGDERAKKE